MRPTLFSFHGFGTEYHIGAYAFFLSLSIGWGFIAGTYALFSLSKKTGKNPKIYSTLLPILSMLAIGIMGARFLHFLLNTEWYAENPTRIFALSFSGFSIYGGILAAALIGLIWARLSTLSIWSIGDAVIPVFTVAGILARLGCWFNGCCYGKVTDLPWGVVFSPESPAFKYEFSAGFVPGVDIFEALRILPVHPTQLYEILALIFGFGLFLLTKKRARRPGVAALVFFIFYTGFRVFNNTLRVTPVTFNASELFYPVFYGILLSLQFIALLLLIRKKTGLG